jgi:hypothetical protein
MLTPMLGSVIVYSGLIVAFLGFVGIVRRRRTFVVLLAGLALTFIGLILPARDSRVGHVGTHLDHFMPVWQFHEVHTMRVEAPPERVYEAVRQVRADEIALFRTLTWIRRGGRELPEGILNPGNRASIIDVATRSGFIYLADDPPHEMVIGTVIAAPKGMRGKLTPDVFRRTLPPGLTLASMNFIVRADGTGSIVSTETRVFANSPATRRRFAAYWRVIYPGSALIRRMWLRAIGRRAEAEPVRGLQAGKPGEKQIL